MSGAARQARHTPGPWILSTMSTDYGWINGPDGMPLATAYPGVRTVKSDADPTFTKTVSVRSNAEVQANAHLIATAPDYHEAAIEMIERHDAEARRCNFDRCGCENCKSFRPIVAKAEGRS